MPALCLWLEGKGKSAERRELTRRVLTPRVSISSRRAYYSSTSHGMSDELRDCTWNGRCTTVENGSFKKKSMQYSLYLFNQNKRIGKNIRSATVIHSSPNIWQMQCPAMCHHHSRLDFAPRRTEQIPRFLSHPEACRQPLRVSG